MKRTLQLKDNKKELWGDGAWVSEPDLVIYYIDEYPCVIMRNDMGSLCGYVGVDPENPIVKDKHYDEFDIEVHGGVTFGHTASMTNFESGQLDAHGDDEKIYTFIGFDCAHYRDLTPALNLTRKMFSSEMSDKYKKLMPHTFLANDDSYRTIAYVENEILSMVNQIKSRSNKKILAIE